MDLKHCVHEIDPNTERCCFCGREGFLAVRAGVPNREHGKFQPVKPIARWKRIPRDQDCDVRRK